MPGTTERARFASNAFWEFAELHGETCRPVAGMAFARLGTRCLELSVRSVRTDEGAGGDGGVQVLCTIQSLSPGLEICERILLEPCCPKLEPATMEGDDATPRSLGTSKPVLQPRSRRMEFVLCRFRPAFLLTGLPLGVCLASVPSTLAAHTWCSRPSAVALSIQDASRKYLLVLLSSATAIWFFYCLCKFCQCYCLWFWRLRCWRQLKCHWLRWRP